MSAAGRGSVRAPHDNYPTPEWATRRFLERACRERGVPSTGLILEPCAGAGAIIKAFGPSETRSWTACELRPECAPDLTWLARKTYIGDFLTRAPLIEQSGVRFDLIISNPPFSLAEEIIRTSLTLSPWVAMLLRINFLGSEERAPWLSKFAPDLYVLPNRPPFALNKHGKPATDATEYAWFVWGPHSRGATRGAYELLDVTPLEERKRHTAALRGVTAVAP